MAPNEDTFLSEYSKFLDSGGSHLTFASLSLYRNFDKELSSKERQFIQSHLDTCASCSKKLKEVIEVEGVDEKIMKMPPAWSSSTLNRYSIAAILLIAVGTAVFYYLRMPQKNLPSKIADHSLAVATPNAEQFEENPMLETYAGRTMRSESSAKFVIPGRSDTLAVPFTFKWEAGTEKKTYVLTVVDNKDVKLWEDSTRNNELRFTKALEPGLYYVKLEADGILSQVGKFVILRLR